MFVSRPSTGSLLPESSTHAQAASVGGSTPTSAPSSGRLLDVHDLDLGAETAQVLERGPDPMLWEANLPHHKAHGWDAGASPRAPSWVWFVSRDISVRLVFNCLELLKELRPGHTALPVAERL